MSGFQEILTTNSPERRRGLWQRAFSRLTQDCLLGFHGTLDALSPEALQTVVAQALQEGWLGPPTQILSPGEALAMQAIELSLPAGSSRQELSRRTLLQREEAPAELFATLQEREIQSATELQEETQGQRARILLCLTLASRRCPRVGALALAIATRPGVARGWLAQASQRSLPNRRAAARLLEHGARGAIEKISRSSGDGWIRRFLTSEAVELAFPRLLADREPLVWHHAAIARGFLAAHHEPFQQAILAELAPERSATEWRRGGTSLAAWLGRSPAQVLPLLEQQLKQGLLRRQQGLGGVLTRGLGATAELNQEVAVEAFGWLLREDPIGAAEALPDAMERGLVPRSEQLQTALGLLQKYTSNQPGSLPDDGLDALRAARVTELLHGHEGTALGTIEDALLAYASRGPREAFALAQEAIQQVEASVAMLALLDEADGGTADETEIRRRLFSVLHHLQRSILQDDRLDALLELGDPGQGEADLSRLIDARDWISEWLLQRSAPSIGAPLHHQSLHIQKIRTLLYTADADARARTTFTQASVFRRRQRIASAMFRRLRSGVPAPLERATCAALARAVDALLLGKDLAPTDVFLLVLKEGLEVEPIRVLIDASANQDVEILLTACLATFREELGSALSMAPPSLPPTQRNPGHEGAAPSSVAFPSITPFRFFSERLRRLRELILQIPQEESSRTEACRLALQGHHDALRQLLLATSVHETLKTSDEGLSLLERSWLELLQLTASAEQRVGLRSDPLLLPPSVLAGLKQAVERQDPGEVSRLLGAMQTALEQTLPSVLSSLSSPIVGSLIALPLTPRARASMNRSPVFPDWVPSNQILGAFRLLSPAGSGGAGSVFIAHRTEDHGVAGAERFALKVPEYSGVAARTLTEDQFFQLFREEAVALLHLPHHPNLARFVTFDLAARPKPILVMELVEGLSLDQVVLMRLPERARVLDILDGVLAGLEVMHALGIGHLDIKPQNVILRGGEEPVLVDFGLAGKTLRPGCGSLSYAAPEVWLGADDPNASPCAADIYAVACIAFEMLVGEPLFTPSSEVAAISAHLAHDGWPTGLKARKESLGGLAQVLHDALRRSPAERLSASAFRKRLRG